MGAAIIVGAIGFFETQEIGKIMIFLCGRPFLLQEGLYVVHDLHSFFHYL